MRCGRSAAANDPPEQTAPLLRCAFSDRLRQMLVSHCLLLREHQCRMRLIDLRLVGTDLCLLHIQLRVDVLDAGLRGRDCASACSRYLASRKECQSCTKTMFWNGTNWGSSLERIQKQLAQMTKAHVAAEEHLSKVTVDEASVEKVVRDTPDVVRPTKFPISTRPMCCCDPDTAGATSLHQIANALNARGVTTPRGGRWYASSVLNALERS